MKKGNLLLIAGILASLVFIGYLGESEPHTMFGYSINIWIVRLAWFVIAASNILGYMKMRK